MENRAFISVIVPNYNHEQYLKQRLDSIFNQTYQDFEVILLDDKSTDGSDKILSEYANHPKVSHCIINDQNSGSPFRQWKKGIELAKGEFIWIAESDDMASKEFLASLAEEIDQNTNLVFCPVQYIDENGNANVQDRKQNFSKIDSTQEFIEKHLLGKNDIITGSSVLFRKKASISFLEKLSTFRYRGDLFLWLSILQNGQVKFFDKAFCLYRVHANNQTAKNTLDSQLIKIRESFVIVEQLTLFGYDIKCLSGVYKFNVRRLSKAKWNYLKIPYMFISVISFRYWRHVLKSL